MKQLKQLSPKQLSPEFIWLKIENLYDLSSDVPIQMTGVWKMLRGTLKLIKEIGL